RGKWVLPGFVQAHLHLCQTLLRNGPENLELLSWLERYIWPGEAAHDAETMAIAARLGLAECLAAGVTAVLDMGTVRHSDALFRSAARAGVRYAGGNVLMDDPETTPANLRVGAQEGLAETERLLCDWQGRERGRLRVAVEPRFAIGCTEQLLRQAALFALEKGLLIHTHASESRAEADRVRARTGAGCVAYLDEVGLLTPATSLAHAVHTVASDWEILVRRQTSVVHCPSSNMRLASGVCPVSELRGAGVHVSLGSDGAACNNRLDPFREMLLATFLPQTRRLPERLSAFEALQMATWEGSRVLHLAGEEGLVPGGRADLAILDPEAGWSLPEGWSEDPYGTIVYSMGRENVFATVVDGVVRYRASDPSVGGLKPRPDEIRAAVDSLRSRI
ncbi:MAG TPA: amidohydrolase family protein, partial [Thermoanaerobaculia bacterium]|nr:amidohydrolase family protein [Thermoanaerobaculia bacterium]